MVEPQDLVVKLTFDTLVARSVLSAYADGLREIAEAIDRAVVGLTPIRDVLAKQ